MPKSVTNGLEITWTESCDIPGLWNKTNLIVRKLRKQPKKGLLLIR